MAHLDNIKPILVQRGDTLSEIAKKYLGDPNKYLEIAAANKIENPNLIAVGQKLFIPTKFDRPLDISEIPTNNRLSIIDNYSPNYNYIVEGDKIYYSRKGHNDYWVDISDNDIARKNLHNFIATKYNYKGYEDNEQEIGLKIKNGSYKYPEATEPKSLTYTSPVIIDYTNYKNKQPLDAEAFKEIYKQVENKKKEDKQRKLKPINPYNNGFSTNTGVYKPIGVKDLKAGWDLLSSIPEMAINYITRQYQKRNANDKESKINIPKTANFSTYGIIPESYTGDTIKVNNNQYILPESIDLNNTRLGIRNRGDYNPINTEGAIITNFNSYLDYNKIDKKDKNATYIGVDPDGNLKIGNIDNFAVGDKLTRTYANKIVSFAKDAKGNQLWKDDAAHGNRGRSVPIVNVLNGNKQVKGSINILSEKGNTKNDTYGNIAGGRIILEAGNERRLVSGSIKDIEKQFNDLKERHNADYVTAYTLDNGSYNRGLRTYNKTLTSSDLRRYDRQNSGGGNFMYIVNNPKYNETFTQTPNVRTVNDDSYKKGHSLQNEQKGIVLHHTAFMEDDLTNVTKHLTDKSSGASSHVIIGYDGSRRVLAKPNQVTFHAGHSRFNNRNDVNDFMIGIEFQGDTNKKDLTNSQINSAVEYLAPIIRKNKISLDNITTHEIVRRLYNDYAYRTGHMPAPNKPDINRNNYVRILNALKRKLYYSKNK